jgi:hypothetical protein
MTFSSTKEFIQFARVVNLVWGLIIAAEGYSKGDSTLVGIGYMMAATDGVLLLTGNYDLGTLQVIRAISTLVVGPYLLFRPTHSIVLRIMGLLLVLTDGALLLQKKI